MSAHQIQHFIKISIFQAMQDCTKDEFAAFINLLTNLKISKLVSGQQVLADIVTEQAELDKPFDVSDFLYCAPIKYFCSLASRCGVRGQIAHVYQECCTIPVAIRNFQRLRSVFVHTSTASP